ncbi:MAG TPA: SAM-dependent methyltransferase [Ktedonobacterales bacterium]|nr:SAM-dependent methyltransferase [Ktedonobacterales bacterium]
MIQLEPIGIVKSTGTEDLDTDWGEVTAEIVLDEALTDGLQGLDAFSHILVVFYMHQATFDPATDLVRRPRGRADMPPIGIFAQRPKMRPNHIGITAVPLLGIEGNIVRVKGLDAVDGTSLLPNCHIPQYSLLDSAMKAIEHSPTFSSHLQ